MASNYKRIGNYIRQVDVRNTDARLGEEDLYGLSVYKEFIPTHANLVGVKFNGYKIVAPGQFTYIPDTSRRGDKIAIGLNGFGKDIIVSSVYTVFEIYKPDELNAEYLMMLFRNPEYDRFARYNSWGSAREVFSWEDFCDSELYIPDIEEQQKIVRQYKTITDRIKILGKINNALMGVLDQIYRDTFYEYREMISNYIPGNDIDLPDGWSIDEAQKYFEITIGKTPPREVVEYFTENKEDFKWVSIADMKTDSPYISDSSEKLTDDAMKDCNMKIVPAGSVLLSFKMTVGRVAIVTEKMTTNEAIAHFRDCKELKYYTFLYLRNFDFASLGSTSSISTAVNSKIIKAMPFLMPPNSVIKEFNEKVDAVFDELYCIKKEIDLLTEMKSYIR